MGLTSRQRSVLGMGMEKWVCGVPMGDGCRELRGRTLTAPSKEWTEEERPGGGYRAEGGKHHQIRRARECRPRIDEEAVRAPRGPSEGCNVHSSHVHRNRLLLEIKAPRMSHWSPRLVGAQRSGASGADKCTPRAGVRGTLPPARDGQGLVRRCRRHRGRCIHQVRKLRPRAGRD